MRRGIVTIICISLALWFTSTASAQGVIYYTLEGSKINRVTMRNLGSPMVFRNVDFTSATTTPQVFKLVFESSFAGQFQTGPNLTPGVPLATGEIEFTSTAQTSGGSACTYNPGGGNRPCQEIRIQVNPGAAPPTDAGWSYKVVIGTVVLDPRVRGT